MDAYDDDDDYTCVGYKQQTWILACPTACKAITHHMLLSLDIRLREFHSTEWRESRYVLIHLEHDSRMSTSALSKMLKPLEKQGVKLDSLVFGVEAVSCTDKSKGDELGDHPGFVRIVQLFMQKNRDLLTSWSSEDDSLDIFSYKKGFVYQYVNSEYRRGVHSSSLALPECGSSSGGKSSTKTDLEKVLDDNATHGYVPKDVQVIEEFTRETLSAIQAANMDEELYRQSERKRMEESLRRGEPPMMGAAYVSYCEAVVMYGSNPYKFGGTGRSDARIRLAELSRSVPQLFRLLVSIPSTDPFKVEAELHQHFEEFRIREGACTEFFNVSLDKILEYVKANFPGADIFPRKPPGVGSVAFGGGWCPVPTTMHSMPPSRTTNAQSSRIKGFQKTLAKMRKENGELRQKLLAFEQQERERQEKERLARESPYACNLQISMMIGSFLPR